MSPGTFPMNTPPPVGIAPEAMRQAQAAADNQDFREVAHVFARALCADPDHPLLRLGHARALGQCGQYAACRQAFKALLREAPRARQAELHGEMGSIWSDLGRHDLAEPHLRALAESTDGPALAHERLVDSLERLNRLEDARAVADRALARFPGQPSLGFLRARVARRMGELGRAETLLRRCLCAPGVHPGLLVAAQYELGHVLDGRGRYREAFAAFELAKTLRRDAPGVERMRRIWRGRTDEAHLAGQLPRADDFRRWAEPFQEGPLRQAFLVGCPRSGTTLLERVLGAHPGIVAAPETWVWRVDALIPTMNDVLRAGCAAGQTPREPELFGAVSKAQLAAAFAAYRRGMDAATETAIGPRLLLDKNPSYFSAISPLMRFFPGAPLLVALRDPRAVVWSCFTQELPLNPETVPYLDLASCVEHTAVKLRHWCLLRGRLATPWRQVRYEEVVHDLPGEAKRILGFLGVPWDDNVLAFHRNKTPVRSPSYASAAQPIHSGALEKWRNYEEFLAPHLAPLKPVMGELGYAW